MRTDDRERVLSSARNRLVDLHVQRAEAGGLPLEEVLATSVYHERRRLDDAPKRDPHRQRDNAFWNGVRRRLGKAGERELQTLLGDAVGRYAEEICGNFNDRVYQMATRALPPMLGLLLNSVSPKRLIRRFKDLPDNARRYIERIESISDVSAAFISVGPGRDETIMCRDLFES